jgi:hypothetical protein
MAIVAIPATGAAQMIRTQSTIATSYLAIVAGYRVSVETCQLTVAEPSG